MTDEEIKTELSALAAEGIAVQAILIGLMNALAKRGVDLKAFEEAFEYAAQVAMIGSDTIGGHSAHMLQVVDKLRESVIRHQGPNKNAQL